MQLTRIWVGVYQEGIMKEGKGAFEAPTHLIEISEPAYRTH